jgi:N-formylglutamate amidohydrolase
LISLPHAGLEVPPEVVELHALTPDDVTAESDEGAAEIFEPLRERVAGFVAARVARAFVDVDRAEDDHRSDGAIKTRTRQGAPVYRTPPDRRLIARLLSTHHRPYHEQLRQLADEVVIGLDCHTTRTTRGAPVRVGTAGFTCDPHLSALLVACLEHAFDVEVALDRPSTGGGHIVRSAPGGISWVKLLVSVEPWIAPGDKARNVAWALNLFRMRLG